MHWEFKQRSSVISVAKRSKDGAGVKKRIRIICLFRLFNAHFPLPQSLVYVFFQNAKSIRWVHTVWSSWWSGGGAQFYWASKRYKLKIASIFWRCLRQFIVDTVSFQSRFWSHAQASDLCRTQCLFWYTSLSHSLFVATIITFEPAMIDLPRLFARNVRKL